MLVSGRATSWVRCGPQNCSPFCGAFLHGVPLLVVALHVPEHCSVPAPPTMSVSVLLTVDDRSAVAG